MEESNSHPDIFNPPWETKQVFLVFLISLFSFFVFSVFLGLYLRYLQHLGTIKAISPKFFVNTVWGDVLMLLYLCIFSLAGYFLVLKKIKGDKIRYFINFSTIKKDALYSIKMYALSFLGAILLGVIIIMFIAVLAVLIKKSPQEAIEAYSKGLDSERAQVVAHIGVLKIIMLVFMAPVIEEVFFRGCLYTALRKNHSVFFSIIVSSLFFAFMHGYFFNFIYISFMGIMGAWIYEKKRSLTAPIFFHFLWNTMVLLLTFLAMKK